MDHSREGEQLLLPLFEGVPWDGRSPRGLTKVGLGLYLGPEPPRHEVHLPPEQFELWPIQGATQREEPRWLYTGAPLL